MGSVSLRSHVDGLLKVSLIKLPTFTVPIMSDSRERVSSAEIHVRTGAANRNKQRPLNTGRRQFLVTAVLLAAILAIGAFVAQARAQPACVVPLGGSKTGIVHGMHDLPGGSVLVGAERGVFRFYPPTGPLLPVGDAQTGFVDFIHPLTDGMVLIGAERGLFRYSAMPTRVSQVSGADTGSVRGIHDVSSGGLLVGASKGLFRLDTRATRVVLVAGVDVGEVWIMFDLPDGGALINADQGWFRFDPLTEHVLPVDGIEKSDRSWGYPAILGLTGSASLVSTGSTLYHLDLPTGRVKELAKTGLVVGMQNLPGGDVLIAGGAGAFRFEAPTQRVLPVDGAGGAETGGIGAAHVLPGGDVLIAANRGWFRFDHATGRALPVNSAAKLEDVGDLLDLRDGAVLIGSKRGPVLFDPPTGQVVSIGGAETGPVYAMHNLPKGDVLIAADQGWFRFDPPTKQVLPMGGAASMTGSHVRLRDIGLKPRWSSWSAGPTGAFFFDYSTGRLRRVLEIESDMYLAFHPLLGGGVLIGTMQGIALVPNKPLADSKFDADTKLQELVPRPEAVEIRTRLEHPCAPVADQLGLALIATVDGKRKGSVPVRLPQDAPPTEASATLAASITFDTPGAWSLELQQRDTPIGQPLHFRIFSPGLLQRATEAWPMLLAGVSVFWVMLSGVLFFIAHQRAWALRIFCDPGWAKWFTWPYWLLRHMAWAQRWVLEPWFQAVRRTTRADVPFLDPPVSTAKGPPSEATALLRQLRVTPRLWLQGRSGLGKSSVFAAWERAFFTAEDVPNLKAAVHQYGFILITLPVRYYATLPLPEANRPESWVLEVVRRRLEEFGFSTHDLALIKAMLNAGQIALALDGANEADRDFALAAFARQFSRVPLLVTSQALGDETWQFWHLPDDVGELRDQLLSLWIGDDSGALLSRRIEVEGLSETIVSGYDLRLVADLVGTDPEHAPLPADRVELYRAMLARARGADGQPPRLVGLKQLAWKMVTERRREIMQEDEKQLGMGTLGAVLREGVRIVRQVGAFYEFRHDQMRAFLAALWLIDEMSLPALKKAVINAAAFTLNRKDQEELWGFLAPLLASAEDLKEMWHFANEEPVDRAILVAALQAEADVRNITLVRTSRARRSKAAVPAPAGA
jgi:hypothetical protein